MAYPEDRIGDWPRWYQMDAAKQIHRVYSMIEAGCALAAANRVVGLTKLDDDTSVWTVFMCLDHGLPHFDAERQGEFAPPELDPVVFETARFDGKFWGGCLRGFCIVNPLRHNARYLG